MPSGSHGGSAGSHGGFSGGGGSRGGSSFGGGSYHRSRPRGPRNFRFGRSVFVVSTGRQSILSIIIFVGVLVLGYLFTSVSIFSGHKEHLNMIEEENRYYLNMVATAKNDSDYVVTGEVTNQFYKTEYERYYITYSFVADDGSTVEGYTFSIYTLETVPKKGSEIELAVDDKTTDSDTDSIPMDYANFTLEDDGEYLKVKKDKAKSVRGIVIGVVVIVCLVGGYILVIVTSKKKQEEKEAEQKAEQKAKEEAEEKKRFCEYCGARVEPSDNVCPQCGARLL